MNNGKLRSQAWFGGRDKTGFLHRTWMRNHGLTDEAFDGRPIIGICNTFSELTPCNAHFRELAEKVKRGVWQAGGVPLEFPVMSLGESNMRPSAMLFRNLASMDVEESLRANPIDGVVLMAGCDKTTPALLMGAISADLPTILLSGGPMLNGRFKGRTIGSGTDIWRFAEEVKAGRMSQEDFMGAEAGMSRSAGSCMTMGTASTMASLSEALGMTLPGNAAIPAVEARRSVIATRTGQRIVDMVREDLRPTDILTDAAFANAVRANAAIGGSTNAVLHLLAIAGRVGLSFGLDDWDRLGRDVPTIVNLMPSGEYLMEDFFDAGGMPVVLCRLLEAGHLDGGVVTANGRTMAENVAEAVSHRPDVIRGYGDALTASGGIVVLKGSLSPGGAVLKPSAASPHLMQHTGRAIVFEDYAHYKEKIADPDLDVDETCILVLKNCGPRGYPGMPEVGNFGLPPKLLKAGVTDMIRISDARMSGTAYGTVILHTAPEAAVGGALALVEDGDLITVDTEGRRLDLLVESEVLDRRRERWKRPSVPEGKSGYLSLYLDAVEQADQGCDFHFLKGVRRAGIPLESH
ncbi:MAG: IlvD/Edd family dehydratase [Pseudomonadota bacterium]